MHRLLSCAVALATLAAPAPAGAQPSPTVPPPTPVPPVGSPSPYPTALDTPAPSSEPPRLDAEAVALADLDSGRVLHEEDATEAHPIASLTKIMTALLVIERTRPTEIVVASPEATGQPGAELGLQPGEERSVSELLTALLLQSANDAAVALAQHVSGSVEAFVDAMNRRALELGMRDTEFRSPSGLDDRGYSTARDLVLLASEAFLDPTFAEIAATKFARVPADAAEPRRLQNRNALLWLYEGSLGGKTGYTSAAGFCIVAAAERDGLRLASVVLGADDQAFNEGAALLNHGFVAWEREEVVDLGEDLDPVRIDSATVPVEADATLSVLVPSGTSVDVRIEPAPGLSLPVEAGEVVASLSAVAGPRQLGEVSLVAAQDVRPPPSAGGGGSFWERLWRAVSGIYGRVFDVLAS